MAQDRLKLTRVPVLYTCAASPCMLPLSRCAAADGVSEERAARRAQREHEGFRERRRSVARVPGPRAVRADPILRLFGRYDGLETGEAVRERGGREVRLD